MPADMKASQYPRIEVVLFEFPGIATFIQVLNYSETLAMWTQATT